MAKKFFTGDSWNSFVDIIKSLLASKSDINHTHSVVSTTDNGFAPVSPGGTAKYLRADGTWTTPPNTNTKVTAVGNHYTPAKSKTISADSTTTATWGSTDMVTGIEMDAAGHVTGVTSIQMPANPNTDTNTSHSHNAGVGLIGSGSAGTDSGTYTYKAKLRSETALTVDSSAAATTSGRVYPVAVDKTGYLAVNVPWTDNNTVYTHPTHTAVTGVPTGNATPAFGGTFNVNQITNNDLGHVTANTSRTITIPSTLSNGTGTAGLIKTTSTVTSNSGYTACPVINGVPYYKDTTYTHPTTSGNKHIPSGGSSGQFLKWSADGTAVWAADNNTTYSVVSTTADGLAPKRDGSTTKFLRADGTWAVPPDNNTTYTSLKNPYSLTIQGDGKTLANGIYDGSAAKTVNITPSAIGAATAAQGTRADNAMPKSGGTFTGAVSGTNISLSGFLNAGGKTSKTDGKTGIIVGATGNMFLQGGAPTVSFYMGSDTSSVGNVLGAKSASNSGLHFTVNNGAGVALWNSTSDIPCYFRPLTTGKAGLGSESYRWYRLWASNSCNTSSDEREKSDIMSIADYPTTWSRDGSGNVFEKLFNKLVPKTYTLNVEPTDEIHMGFIAQDVATAFEELGLSEDDLGFISHDYWTDEETGEEKDRYGLAYEEFIALNTYMIQKQRDKIESLEERIAQLEELVKTA